MNLTGSPDYRVEEQKDALIRDLRRQLAELQPVAPEPKRELLDELREAPGKATTAAPATSLKVGRHLGLWRSPVVLGVVAGVSGDRDGPCRRRPASRRARSGCRGDRA